MTSPVGPDEGPGIIIVSFRHQLMAAWSSAIERKTPRRMRWRVILEKIFNRIEPGPGGGGEVKDPSAGGGRARR